MENSRSRSFLTGDQHHAEACFALHHASVGVCSLFERKCLIIGRILSRTLKARVSSLSIAVPASDL